MSIIIGLSGGLGNQLYQYALGKSLEKKGLDVKYDTSFFDGFRSFRLNSLTTGTDLIDYHNCSIRTAFYLKFRRTKGLCKILRFVYSNIFHFLIVENKQSIFDERIKKLDNNNYLEGHWASLLYFDHIKKDLQNEIALRTEFYTESFKEYHKQIKETKNSSVSIHIRRTDYLRPEVAKTFRNLTEGNYYSNAINLIKTKVKNPKFFIFSDDIDWCKNNLKINNATYVLPKEDMNDYHDFELIKQCHYNINANSTFSWWAAYLNQNSQKIVIVPEKWFNDSTFQMRYKNGPYIPEEWIKVIG